MRLIKKKRFWIIGLSIILLICFTASAFAGNYLVNYALAVDESGNLGSMSQPYTSIQNTAAQKEYNNWIKTINSKQWTLKSDDSLQLKGYYYPSSQISHDYVLAVHGYTGNHRDIVPAIKTFVEKGYHVLAIDQRGRGESEGDFVSMGWKEKDDVAKWITKIIAYDKQANITLYGVSMGAATVMLTAALPLPQNVKAVMEDCGYTSAYAMFKDQLKERFSLPEFPFLLAARFMNRVRFQFDFNDASPLKQLQASKLPILFIHGAKDDYVPTYMGKQLYNAYQNEKQLLIIKNAGHAQSSDVDPQKYYTSVFNFMERYAK